MSATGKRGKDGKDVARESVVSPGGEGSSTFTVGPGAVRIPGKPALTRAINGVEVDLWRNVAKDTDIERLEKILSAAAVDSAYDLVDFIRKIEYQGFDREFYIKHCLNIMSVSLFIRFAILGALRGSNFQKVVDTCEEMPADMVAGFSTCGFVKTPKKRTDITILRNTASIPHWCAFWFQKAGIAKKIPSIDCPAAIQFPGAASLPMKKEVRIQHIEFCQRFSMLLPGGNFNFNIYLTAYNNQIPITDIPQEVLAVLQVASSSESHALTDDEVKTYSSTLTLRPK